MAHLTSLSLMNAKGPGILCLWPVGSAHEMPRGGLIVSGLLL